MTFEPEEPFPKGKGDSIRSEDWNAAIEELKGKESKGKVDRAGDTIDGDLTVLGNLLLEGNIGDPPSPSIEGREPRGGPGTLSGTTISGNLTVEQDLTVKQDLTVEGTIEGTLAEGSVGSTQLAVDAVTRARVADEAISTDELADDAVTRAKVADEAISTDELADDAVTRAKVDTGAISRAKLADNAVNSSKLARNAVTSSEIASRAVTSIKIDNDAVTSAKLRSGAVGFDALQRRIDVPQDEWVDFKGGGQARGLLRVWKTGGDQRRTLLGIVNNGENHHFPPPAAVGGRSHIRGIAGLSAAAESGTDALVVEGSAKITGGVSSGHLVETFINASGEDLHTGDLVRLAGTPVKRFHGVDDKIPVSEVTLSDEAAQATVIGIVDCQAPPGPREPDRRSEPEDRGTIPHGEELNVVTLGCFAHCHVDASEHPLGVGTLLCSSDTPGHACAATEPKLGTIVGKALEPLDEGTGYIAVLVNLH